jgi:hypothetical protein
MFRIIVVILVFAGSVPANAWNSVGHQIVAEMVWQKMSRAQRRQASDLLKQHPHYKELLTENVPRGVDTNEWAFLTAAVWPDMVRPEWRGNVEAISKYNVYPHGIGYPFMRPAETNHALIEKIVIDKPDAEMVLSNAFVTLGNTNASAHDRAVSLCWALHLCGDLHQPLHTSNLVTTERPGGEGGGQRHRVKDGNGKEMTLHMFWDILPGLDDSYRTLVGSARHISGDAKIKRATRDDFQRDKTVASWVQESFHTAVEFAYQGGNLPFVHDDDLKSGKVQHSQIPQLPDDYISEAHKIAERRLRLAADRLSVEMKKLR